MEVLILSLRGGVPLELIENIESINQEIQNIKNTKASTTNYGIVKLSNANNITDSLGLAIPASENNAAISGSLANKIANIESKLNKAFTPIGIGDGTKSIKELLEEVLVQENFNNTRTRRWFLNGFKDDHRVWSTCTATLAGGGTELNYSGLLITNWNEDSYVFYYYPKSNAWRFHKIADALPEIEEI